MSRAPGRVRAFSARTGQPGDALHQTEAATSPTPRADRGMLCAAGLFTAATAYGSTVAIRLDLAGEPFGIKVPLSVPAAVCVGWGAAVSAPWPMPALALLAARRAGRSTGRGPGLVHIGLGTAALVVGGLGESVMRTPRSQAKPVRIAIAVNLLAAAALVEAGLHEVLRRPRSRPEQDRCNRPGGSLWVVA